MSSLESLLEPDPQFLIWETGRWVFTWSVMVIGWLSLAYWNYVGALLDSVGEGERGPWWLRLGAVLLLGAVALFIVVFVVIYAPVSMPRHMDQPFILRALPGLVTIVAAAVGAWKMRDIPTLSGAWPFVLGIPIVMVALGLFNDWVSRAAAAIPMSSSLVYLLGAGLALWLFISQARR